MKFNLILLFLILLSINVLGQEIILPRNIYSPYETLQARLSLNFLPVKDIQLNQIFLFDSSNKSYFIAPFLIKFDNNNYYIYFDLPYNTKKDNYTLRISKILHILNNILMEKTIIKEFSIINDTHVISISPAIINLSSPSQEFYIKVFNHGNLTTLTIRTSNGITHPYDQPQQIGNSRSFKFSANSKSPEEQVIFLYNQKNYTVPIYTNFREQSIINITIPVNQTNITIPVNQTNITIPVNQTNITIPVNQTNITIPVNQTNITTKKNIIYPIILITNLSSIKRYLSKTETLQGPLPIKNNLNQSIILNFSLNGNLNDIVNINATSLTLEPYEIKEQYFIVNPNKNATYYEYSGNLSITTLNYSIIFPMNFYITQEIKESLKEKNEEIYKTLFNEPEQEIKEPFENKTIKPNLENKESNNTILIISLIIIMIILIIILILTRKKHREITFGEYMKTIERK